MGVLQLSISLLLSADFDREKDNKFCMNIKVHSSVCLGRITSFTYQIFVYYIKYKSDVQNMLKIIENFYWLPKSSCKRFSSKYRGRHHKVLRNNLESGFFTTIATIIRVYKLKTILLSAIRSKGPKFWWEFGNSLNLTLTRPLCRKLRVSRLFDVFKTTESSFLNRTSLTPFRFFIWIFWKISI